MGLDLFLDCGAFSAHSIGAEIDIGEYVEYIKQNIDYINHYSVLDVISNPAATLKNQLMMERLGLNPIPCFHYGEDMKYLEYYLKHYDYISLGGMVPVSTGDLIAWLNELFLHYLCDSDGMPVVRVHGFGLTAIPLLWSYPWYSVDGSSWLKVAAFGSIIIPTLKADGPDYTGCSILSVTSRGVRSADHFLNLSRLEQKRVLSYISGFGITDIEAFDIPDTEVYNGTLARKKVCAHFFVELSRSLPQWPWAFKSAVVQGRLGI